MKKFLQLTIFFMIFCGAYAQHGFDQKTKTGTASKAPVNHARQVSGRYVPANTATHRMQARTLSNNLQNGKGNLRLSLSSTNEVVVHTGDDKHLPAMIEFKRGSTYRVAAPQNEEEAAAIFLEELKPFLKISDRASFEITAHDPSRVKMIQRYKGIEIYGAEVLLHFDNSGLGRLFNGKYLTCDMELDTTYSISAQQAIEATLTDLAQKTKIVPLTDKEKAFYHYDGPVVKKVLFEQKELIRTYHMAYEIAIKPNVLDNWVYIIDGRSGRVLNSYNQLCAADGHRHATAHDLHGISRAINTYQEGREFFLADVSKPMFNRNKMEGIIYTLDARRSTGNNFDYIKSSNNQWNNRTAVSAHYNASHAYDYFYHNHQRNSINGKGGSIFSFINVTDEHGHEMDNAYWNGHAIFYGNGHTYFKPFAAAIDVAGHEMSHGVVQNTAGLIYQDEPGAINESMSDIFGFMMDTLNWTIGEDVVNKAYFAGGALRNMQNPNQTGKNDLGWQPKHVSEQYHGPEDHGGVHINSGITNHAFYHLAISSSKRKAADIFYRALAVYLTRSSKFIDLRLACVQSAKDLFGENAAEVEKVHMAFNMVGIGGEVTPPVVITFPENPGDQYLLCVNTDFSDPHSLYKVNADITEFEALTDMPLANKPSVTDDGMLIAFVGTDHMIYLIDMEEEEVFLLQDEPIWGNVALSKDGTKLAAVTNVQDTSIYVYEVNKNEWAMFELYNPTYSGVKSGGPVYADALEWDYSGEYLVYDAYNLVQSSSGEDLEYWDVNFIKVWDNKLNDFGSGEVEKLFASLPKDVSIGNPSFAKNVPNVIVFDYINSATEEMAIIGFDLETGEDDLIFLNNSLGWPSFSKTDQQLVFATIYEGRECIGYVDVAPNRISAAGEGQLLIVDATWPVAYADGERDIIMNKKQPVKKDLDLQVQVYPNPFADHIKVRYEGSRPEINIYNSIGSQMTGFHYTDHETLDVSTLQDGLYMVEVVAGNSKKTFQMVRKR